MVLPQTGQNGPDLLPATPSPRSGPLPSIAAKAIPSSAHRYPRATRNGSKWRLVARERGPDVVPPFSGVEATPSPAIRSHIIDVVALAVTPHVAIGESGLSAVVATRLTYAGGSLHSLFGLRGSS